MGVRGQYVFLLTLDKGHFITVMNLLHRHAGCDKIEQNMFRKLH